MTSRRVMLLDAAIEILGTRGVRGLTHRAVDDEAGLAQGSTSNHFRSRDALLEGVMERFIERERAAFETLARSDVPLTPDDLGRVFGQFAAQSTTTQRTLTLARHALLVEGALRPALQRSIADGGGLVNEWGIQWLRVIRSHNPERDWVILANFVTGLVLHELAHPSEHFDPTARITELITMLLEAP